MRSVRKWGFLMAAAVCSAMLFSMPANVSAEEPQGGRESAAESQESDFVLSGTTLTAYKGTDEVVTVPEGVTRIGPMAFWNNDTVKKIVLPKSCGDIMDGAFVRTLNLKEIVINYKGITLGPQQIFSSNPLTVYGYPYSELPLYCSKWNLTFSALEQPASEQYKVDENGTLTEFWVAGEEAVIPEGVKYISPEAIKNGELLRKVTLPESCDRVGRTAFESCANMKEAVIYSKDLLLESFVSIFPYEGPYTVHGYQHSEIFGYCYDLGIAFVPLGLPEPEKYSVDQDGLLTEFWVTEEEETIPEGVMDIAYDAIKNGNVLHKVILPESLSSFNTHGFDRCGNLGEVVAKCKNMRFKKKTEYFGSQPISIYGYTFSNALEYCDLYGNLTYVSMGTGLSPMEWDNQYKTSRSRRDGTVFYTIDTEPWRIYRKDSVKVYVDGKEYGSDKVQITGYALPPFATGGGVGWGEFARISFDEKALLEKPAKVKIVADEFLHVGKDYQYDGAAEKVVIEFEANCDGLTDGGGKPVVNERHVENVPEGKGEFSPAKMQELVGINKGADVVFRTPQGVEFTFAKGTMHMVDGMGSYPFGVVLVTEFGKSGISNAKVTEDIFACRINFEYSGELPGTAKVSIPVGSKWEGRTLYYYQVMADGTLKDTGKSGKVVNGVWVVSQSHCSDYVLLAKTPKAIGVAAADSKPASPKTGDNQMAWLFLVACMGACMIGAKAFMAGRKSA